MRRCVVLCPYLTHIEPACERGLRELEKRGLDVRRFPSSAAVDRARCDVATAALGEGFDELMWIDSDISFDADDVARLRVVIDQVACLTDHAAVAWHRRVTTS